MEKQNAKKNNFPLIFKQIFQFSKKLFKFTQNSSFILKNYFSF